METFEEFRRKCEYRSTPNNCHQGWINCCESICPLFNKAENVEVKKEPIQPKTYKAKKKHLMYVEPGDEYVTGFLVIIKWDGYYIYTGEVDIDYDFEKYEIDHETLTEV